MGRQIHKLSDVQLRKSKLKAGLHADGAGLYARVSNTGAIAFTFISIRRGRRQELGLGGWPQTSLATARDKARDAHELISKGLDPRTEWRKALPLTLADLSTKFCDTFASTVTPRVCKQWRRLVINHAGPLLKLRADEIDVGNLSARLIMVQASSAVTAVALRAHVERLMDYAKVLGMRSGDNPAVFKGRLEHVLPPLGHETKNHRSLPHSEAPACFKEVVRSEDRARQAIALLMLTMTRTMETANAHWREVDMGNAVWTVPANRMKARLEFRIPLSETALSILRKRHDATGGVGFLFAATPEDERGLSHLAMGAAFKAMKQTTTIHGLRTTGRTWLTDKTDTAEHVAEGCLAHVTGNRTARAYQRSDLLNRRRTALDLYAAYLTA